MVAGDAVLIVGGDGKVGAALVQHLEAAGENVLRTTRRCDAIDARTTFLDLTHPDHWQPPTGIRAAILCAAFTNIEACRADPGGARAVNVDGVLRVAQTLQARGVFLVFLSTNAVFDGTKPWRRPEEPTCPMTEYGRQKAEVEQRLSALSRDLAIVRFAKILEPRVPLFAKWHEQLRAGQPIAPFADMYFAPVPLANAIAHLHLITRRQQGGIFHVSGDRDISYAQAACWLAEEMNASADLVRPISYTEAGVHAHVPRHTTLHTDAPVPVEATVRQAMREVMRRSANCSQQSAEREC